MRSFRKRAHSKPELAWRRANINAHGRSIPWEGRVSPYPTHLGCMDGSPPGVPGGGITGVAPGVGSGTGGAMPGSVPAGGRITPLLRSRRSLKVSPGRLFEAVAFGSCGGDFCVSCAGGAAKEGEDAKAVMAPNSRDVLIARCTAFGLGVMCFLSVIDRKPPARRPVPEYPTAQPLTPSLFPWERRRPLAAHSAGVAASWDLPRESAHIPSALAKMTPAMAAVTISTESKPPRRCKAPMMGTASPPTVKPKKKRSE
jgi:hypothetical protein